MDGNYFATTRVKRVKEILTGIGLEPERVEMYYNSSGMGPQFAQTCMEFTERIRRLGPLPGKPKNLKPQPQACAVGG